MTHHELSKILARQVLLKEGGGEIESFNSLICLISYFSEMSIEELLGIASQYGLSDLGFFDSLADR